MSTGTASHNSDSDYEDDTGCFPSSRHLGKELPQPCVSLSISPSKGRNSDSIKFIQASSRKISSQSFAKLLAGLDMEKCHSVAERILNRPVMKAFAADSHFTKEAIPLASGLSLVDF
ncbi:hypothetical protein BV898_05848 [Hypsibius exemplaris]|uniref:Uncharacterized protein n=1 Tax=Hypsibius exemplaris TaxID=2072580 RepID=A0A1W0WYL8_HYPEX|nr:hypothetical protein BV898_05848 [Hypsibius exemplaris]